MKTAPRITEVLWRDIVRTATLRLAAMGRTLHLVLRIDNDVADPTVVWYRGVALDAYGHHVTGLNAGCFVGNIRTDAEQIDFIIEGITEDVMSVLDDIALGVTPVGVVPGRAA
jgi:hypothetical protein